MGTITWLFLVSLAGFLYSEILRGCYFTSLSQYRNEFEHFLENIETSDCNHVFISYAKLVDNELNRWTQTTNRLPGPKDSTGMEDLAYLYLKAEERAHFVETTVKFLREMDFDGLDLSFEDAKEMGTTFEDRQRLAHLIREHSKALKVEMSTSEKEFTLTDDFWYNENSLLDPGGPEDVDIEVRL